MVKLVKKIHDQFFETFFWNVISEKWRLWIFVNYLIDVARWALCRIPHLTGFLQNYTIKESSASSYPLFLAKKKIILQGKRIITDAGALKNHLFL